MSFNHIFRNGSPRCGARGGPRLSARTALLALGVLSLAFAPGLAMAHGDLDSTIPEPNSKVKKAPDHLVIKLFGDGDFGELEGDFGDDHLNGGDGSDEADGGPGTDTCVRSETTANCES